MSMTIGEGGLMPEGWRCPTCGEPGTWSRGTIDDERVTRCGGGHRWLVLNVAEPVPAELFEYIEALAWSLAQSDRQAFDRARRRTCEMHPELEAILARQERRILRRLRRLAALEKLEERSRR
jgi:hypothetical protein